MTTREDELRARIAATSNNDVRTRAQQKLDRAERQAYQHQRKVLLDECEAILDRGPDRYRIEMA